MLKSIIVFLAIGVTNVSAAALTGTVAVTVADATRLDAAVGSGGFIIDYTTGSTETAQVLHVVIKKEALLGTGIAVTNYEVLYGDTCAAADAAATTTTATEPELAADTVLTVGSATVDTAIEIQAGTTAAFASSKCIRIKINAVAVFKSKGCLKDMVSVTGSADRTHTGLSNMTLSAVTNAQVATSSYGTTDNPCKFCTNTANAAIAADKNCFCGVADGSMTAASGLVCAGSTNGCKKTAGDTTAEDAYACAAAAAASGTSTVYLALGTVFMTLLIRRTL